MTGEQTPPARTGATVIGATLILIGGLWLLSQAFEFDLWGEYWPFIVIVPGLAAVVAGVSSGQTSGLGLAIPGAIVLMTGLLLLYQDSADHYESWAYAWSLVAPTGPGLALYAVGHRVGDEKMRLAGRIMVIVGVVLFVVGFAFFELLIGISGRDYGQWGSAIVAGALIAAGVALIVRRR
jgi:hypothetical protein